VWLRRSPGVTPKVPSSAGDHLVGGHVILRRHAQRHTESQYASEQQLFGFNLLHVHSFRLLGNVSFWFGSSIGTVGIQARWIA